MTQTEQAQAAIEQLALIEERVTDASLQWQNFMLAKENSFLKGFLKYADEVVANLDEKCRQLSKELNRSYASPWQETDEFFVADDDERIKKIDIAEQAPVDVNALRPPQIEPPEGLTPSQRRKWIKERRSTPLFMTGDKKDEYT
jgi:hypothetical protein